MGWTKLGLSTGMRLRAAQMVKLKDLKWRRVALVDDLFDCLVLELDSVFRSLHLLFYISVLTSYLSTDLGEYHDRNSQVLQV